MPRHKRSNLLCEPMQFAGDLQGQDNLACSDSQRRLDTLKMELMHSQVGASSENVLCSVFAQSLATASENKERWLASGPINSFAIPTVSDQGRW